MLIDDAGVVLVLLSLLLEYGLHFRATDFETAFLVKRNVVLTAVELCLPASYVLGHRVQGAEHVEAQPLSLMVLGDANLFNVADSGAVLNAFIVFLLETRNKYPDSRKDLQFLLSNHGTCSYNLALMLNNKIVVGAFAASVHLIVSLVEFLFCDICHPCQIAKAFKKSLGIISLFKRSDAESLW